MVDLGQLHVAGQELPKRCFDFSFISRKHPGHEQPLQPAPWPVVVFWDRPTQALNPPTKADAALDAGQAKIQDGQRRESPSVAIADQDPGQAVAQDGNPTRAGDTTADSDMCRKHALLSGTWHAVPACIFIDSGATCDFVSRGYVEKHNWQSVPALDVS
jgi:hypothetical protein